MNGLIGPQSNHSGTNLSVVSTGDSGQKRRRVGLACGVCRTRKSRCDGARPKCSSCAENSYNCVYVHAEASPQNTVGKQYVLDLEDRVKAIEVELASIRKTRPALSFADEVGGVEARHTEQSSTGHRRNVGIEVNRDNLHDSTDAEDMTDGMVAVIFSAEDDFGFFGPSSNIAFTRHISHAITSSSGSTQAWTASNLVLSQLNGGVMSVSRPASPNGTQTAHTRGPQSEKVNIYALPPEKETRDLIEHYFSTTGLLFPYLHEPTFWRTYEEVKSNRFTKVRRTWLGLLNIVLALATSSRVRNETTARNRVKESDTYYQRALGLCEKQFLRASSVEAVHLLLVMGQYLQGTQKSVQAWNIHGLTVKAALQLGLHSSEASGRFSPFEQEIRKRTWYGCVVLDRTLSMTFGRPATIPDDYVKLPKPILLEEDLSSTIRDNSTLTDSILFFNSTISLYKIMWSIIMVLYDGNIGCSSPSSLLDTVSHLFKMEQQLVKWQQNLPPNLGLRNAQDFPTENPGANERFRVILTLRYHNLRILLHRTMLVRFLNLIGGDNLCNQEAPLLQQVGINSVQICIQSSIEIISLVSNIVRFGDNERKMLGAWWFSLYYTFNAALVVCASYIIYRSGKIPESAQIVPPERLRACVDDAAQTLESLDLENQTINTCAKYLRQLTAVLDILISDPHQFGGGEQNAMFLQNQNYPNGSQGGDGNRNNGLSPFGMGMDLGELILDGDLEFLNQMTLPLNAGLLAHSN